MDLSQNAKHTIIIWKSPLQKQLSCQNIQDIYGIEVFYSISQSSKFGGVLRIIWRLTFLFLRKKNFVVTANYNYLTHTVLMRSHKVLWRNTGPSCSKHR